MNRRQWLILFLIAALFAVAIWLGPPPADFAGVERVRIWCGGHRPREGDRP